MNWFSRRSTDLATWMALIVLTSLLVFPHLITLAILLVILLAGEVRLNRWGRGIRSFFTELTKD